MRKIFTLLLIGLCLTLNSCGPTLSPSIEYENISYGGGVVKNIKVKWNKYYIQGRPEVKFCGGLYQTTIIDKDSDFFGPIHIEWENAKGKKLTKDLIFTKDELPSMKNRNKLGLKYDSRVSLYFTENDVYLVTSDTPNHQEIKNDLFKKAGLTCQEYRDREYKKKWGASNSDDPIIIYESLPKDSPMRKRLAAEYEKEKASRVKK